jgi:predicted XRE-type DNA-binding protein
MLQQTGLEAEDLDDGCDPSDKARRLLFDALRKEAATWSMKQGQIATYLGTDRQRVNFLLRGRMARFSLASLFDLSVRAGLSVRIEVAPAKGRRKAAA